MARVNDPLIDVLTRRQVLLERLKASYTKNYESTTLLKLDREIRSTLAALDGEGKISAEVSIARLEQVIAKLRTKQKAVYDQFIKDFMIENKEFAGESAEFETKVLQAHTIAGTAIATPSAAVAFKLAESMPIRATGELLEPFLTGWASSEIKRVEGAVRNGYYNGLTNSQLVTQIRGTKKNNYSDGILARNADNTRTIVRTAVQHVANTARQATWEANDDIVDGYTIIATLDGKTSTICRSLDHKSFKIGEGPVPPLHPNCRSTTIPNIKKEYRSNDAIGTRSSMNGYVSGGDTYYEWLKTQPLAFQKLAIGSSRAKLLNDGGLSAAKFAQLNLGRAFEPLTLAEMRKIDPNAFQRAGL